ncbi:rod-binding protein [Tropicimonas sp. S265A]|uniref:rod-binding protein n=1 Tax=Tropicimonas sp. S265A TaxID=3415134 RepID=UPI003C7E5668
MDSISSVRSGPLVRSQADLAEVAEKLEAAFLSEMLKAAGVGRPLSVMGGGIGEEQFSSFLRDEYASNLARSGGLGLAESIIRSLEKAAQND